MYTLKDVGPNKCVNGALVPMSDEERQAVAAEWNAAAADPEKIMARFVAIIQKRLDDFARTRNYDGILSACTYATDPNPKFAAEGQYCVVKRGETWATGYTILSQVQSGARPMPTSIADIEAVLPVLVWPT